MPKKSSKIFIRQGDDAVEFMWADVLGDGSVKMGLLADAIEEVEFVTDAVGGELRKPDIVTERRIGRPEVTFHSSGKYKLSGRIGLDPATLDRATIAGPPLAEICAPRRMLEILLPKMLPEARLTPATADIVLTVPDENVLPLRLTISCMAKGEFDRVLDSEAFFVDTSDWECTRALENDSHVWVWTLRSSRNDQYFCNKVCMQLIGPIKWGGPSRAGQKRQED